MSFDCPCCKSELDVSQDSSSVSFRCKKCKKRSREYYKNVQDAYLDFLKNPYNCPEDDPEKQKKMNRQKELDSINRILQPQKINQEFNSRPKKMPEPNQSASSDETEETASDFQTKDARDKVLRKIKLDPFLEDTFDDGFENQTFEVIHVIQKKPTKPEPASKESCKIINPKLFNILKEKDRLPYRHQVETLEKSMDGNNVYIKSPTSSGKTISFLLPILNEILNSDSKKLCAVIIYPTKALTKDQFKEIEEYAKVLDVNLARLDGNIGKKEDGTIDQKRRIDILSKNPQILLTNIDFIENHMGEHDPFSNKLNELMMDFKFLVIDEIHKYDGTFGTKLRGTLQRMNYKYGNFQIIAASATLDNPEEFANSLGLGHVDVVTGQGNRGMMTISMIYPGPLHDQKDVMVNILGKFRERNYRSLSFSNSRMGAEEIALAASESGIKIKVHRAGLLPEVIEKNENEFLHGELDSLSSTPTLEVGINIGDLTGVVSEFVPYYTLTQRIGRGGRSGQDSYGFVVLDAGDPVSQFYKFHPHYYEKDNLDLLVDVNNDLLKKITLLLASRDKPFTEKDIETIKANSDSSSFPGYGESMGSLMENDMLVQNDDGNFIPTQSITEKNLKNFSLRDIGQTVQIKLDGKKIGDWDMPMAFEKLFEESIYLHNKETYRCSKFSENKFPPEIVSDVNLVTGIEENLRTKPIVDIVPEIEETLSEKHVFGLGFSLCFLNIKKTIAEYLQFGTSSPDKKTSDTKTALPFERKSIQPCSIDNPTTGIVVDLKDAMPEILESPQIKQDTHSALHSLEHLLIQAGNSMAGGVSGDIDGITVSDKNKIFIFDKSTNGGNGASNRIFSNVKDLIQRADEIVKLCDCKSGCPKCIQYSSCSKRNQSLTKTGVITLLKILIKGDGFVDKYDVQQDDVQQDDVQQDDVQQDDVPPKDWMTKSMEDEKTEFKSSIRINVWKYDQGERDPQKLKDPTLVENIVKTICGFGNADGGELIIGKRDDGKIFGLEDDMKLLKEPNEDQLKNYLATMLREQIKHMGFISKLKIYSDTVDEKTICLVKVPRHGKDPIFTSKQKFYVRIQTSTQDLGGQEQFDYIKENFPSR